MDLIKTFLYFAVFKYPITKEEALAFCPYEADNIDLEIENLIKRKSLFKIRDFYLPYDNPLWVDRRIKGNQLAEKKMKKARKMAAFLNGFPFVRSVMVSGSLAKGYMDASSDIDFFVIMKPGNIAITKIMIGSCRRFFAKKSLCVNFMIDSNHLEMRNQNIYSAVEVATLIPMINFELYNSFMSANKHWVNAHLPNFVIKEKGPEEYKIGVLKALFEKLLSFKPASGLNRRITDFYKKMHRSNNPVHYDKNVSSGELIVEQGVLKFHNGSYEQQILGLYHTYYESFVSNEETIFHEHFIH